jgi:hypothetical protein
MITNKECDMIFTKGLIEGLTSRLNSLIKLNENPDNRSDLTEEINQVKNEIIINKHKLKQMSYGK